VQTRDKVHGEPSSSLLSSQLLWNHPDHLKSTANNLKELTMFTRHVIMELKPNATAEFAPVVESKVLPLLRKQKGFRDIITFLAPDRSEAIAISFWDTKEEAEAYDVSGYPEVLKTLTSLVEGTPRVGVAELATSTLHKLAAAKTA
jgi:heme-degrading monooxygenase HmoA